MLQRKITQQIEQHLRSNSRRMMIIDGARQIGKSYIIREIGQRLFANYIEINMESDKMNNRLFADATSVEKFYLALSAIAGDKMKDKASTLVFIDEIQAYDHLLTLTKFLMEDNRFTYIASGSQLGVTLKKTQSIPIGSLLQVSMYPLDFEEWLWANGVGEDLISQMRNCFVQKQSLAEPLHRQIMDLFRRYLLVGGMPDAVNSYLMEHNIVQVRSVHNDIYSLYTDDIAKYEKESRRKLKTQRIFEMIPSNLENKKKRIVVKDIEQKVGKRTSDYQDEFDYLVSAGVCLEVDAISQPTYPLIQNAGKNLLKLYINDIGLLATRLFGTNIQPILTDVKSVNLGAVYENVVAQELKAHGYSLFYYDNKRFGEVDYLIDDTQHVSVLPIEVKSGKDYKVHSALDTFLHHSDYGIEEGVVLSNERCISQENGVWYLPIYMVMFFTPDTNKNIYF